MGQVDAQAQQGRDAIVWADWCQGLTQDQIAAKHGIPQRTVSDMVRRYAASIPEHEKAAYRARAILRYEELYQAHRQAGLERPRVAAIVRGILDSQNRVLGLVQTQVQHSGQVDHAHWTPGPSVAEVLDDWRRRGILQAQITRRDP
jgi:Homeodomain-like domain